VADADQLERLRTTLRSVVADEVTEQRRRAKASDREPLSGLDERQMARAILNRELDLRASEAVRLGEQPLSTGDRADVVEEVISLVFSPLPRLEKFTAPSDVVNVYVQGCREVRVERLDGSVERHPSPFVSNSDLTEFLAQVARRSGHVEHEFNYSQPIIRVPLPDGSRLAANAWLGPEPYATIRKHPLVDHDLAALETLGMLSDGLRSLLGAAVRARWNFLFAGGQGNGKTTLMRAAAHEAHPDERTVTIEAVPELHLDQLPARHNHVVALWERPANMQGEGAVTAADLAWHAKHLSPDRILVGEVLADEVVPMLEAMSQGIRGAMCTIHATSSAAVFPRLPVYARASGRDWRSSDIYELAAQAVDLVVFVARDRDRRRVVAEVRYVDRFDPETGRLVTDAWFAPDAAGRAAPASVIPARLLDELVEHGYRPALRRSVEAV
jgi:Flp pilus assembly CpaF family ATPase